jgi:MFS family permease
MNRATRTEPGGGETVSPRQDAEEEAVSTFGSLRVRNYRLYFTGQGVSVAGSWMQNIAIGWLALQLSHSGTVLGIITGARFLPLLLLGPWGGLIADRADNRRLLTYTQAAMAAVSFVLATLSLLQLVTLPVLAVLVLCLGMVNVVDGPSRQILISQLVDRKLLRNAIALNSVAMNFSRVLGPGVGGALIAGVGVTSCFYFNAVSFVAVIASLLMMRTSELFPSKREVREKGQIRAGLRHVRGTPELLRPLVLVTITGIFTWEFPVTMPLITATTFRQGASAYGIAMACLGVGAVCGGLVAARRRKLTVRSLAVSAVLWGAAIIAAALAPTLPVLFVLLVVVGSGSITFNSSAKTLLQLASAPQMRGRVMSLWSIAWQGSTVIGAPAVGAVGALLGARYALLTGGVAAVIAGAAIVALRNTSPTVRSDTLVETPPEE